MAYFNNDGDTVSFSSSSQPLFEVCFLTTSSRVESKGKIFFCLVLLIEILILW